MRAAIGEDGKSYYVDGNMTYDEWRKHFNIKNGNKNDIIKAADAVSAQSKHVK